MRVLLLYDYPPSPGGLATQGELLFRGLREMGVEAHAVNSENACEKDLRVITWVETARAELRRRGDLSGSLPPCLVPFMRPGDADWRARYALLNPPGEYHNGGVWPFICGYYVAACVAAGRNKLAERHLQALTSLVKPWHENPSGWGFNEQVKAQTGEPIGRDWQTWSAAMFLYAAKCVETRSTPWFDQIRDNYYAAGWGTP